MIRIKMIAWAVCLMSVAVQPIAARDEAVFDPADFCLNVSQMLPASYPSRALSYGYSVAVRNDSAFVHLPYMGRVYRPMWNDEGLNFGLPVEGFKVKDMRKGARRVEFTVRHQSVRYDFSLTVYPNGHADIYLRPDNAQSISYLADVDEEDEKKADDGQ